MSGQVCLSQWPPAWDWMLVLRSHRSTKTYPVPHLGSTALGEQEEQRVVLQHSIHWVRQIPGDCHCPRSFAFRFYVIPRTQEKCPVWCQPLWPYQEGFIDWINRHVIPGYNIKSFKDLGPRSQKAKRGRGRGKAAGCSHISSVSVLSGMNSRNLLRALLPSQAPWEELCGSPCRVLQRFSKLP